MAHYSRSWDQSSKNVPGVCAASSPDRSPDVALWRLSGASGHFIEIAGARSVVCRQASVAKPLLAQQFVIPLMPNLPQRFVSRFASHLATMRTFIANACPLRNYQNSGGGATCDRHTMITLTNSRFFRDDEQASSRIPVRNAGKARSADRPRRKDAGGEAGAE